MMNDPHTSGSDTFKNPVRDAEKSIYREMLPYYLDRIDLLDFNIENEEFASSWMQRFFGRKRSVFNIKSSYAAGKKLKRLYFESRNIERRRGFRSLGFGFPLFLASEDGELLAAPMFIWSLQLDPNPDFSDSWLLSSLPAHPIRYNHFLVQYISDKYGLDFSDRFKELSRGNKGNLKALLIFCRELASALDLEFDSHEPALKPIPGIDEVDELAGTGNICLSGVMALFSPQSLYQENPYPEEFPSQQTKPGDGHPFGLLDLDPFQATVAHAVFNNKITLAEGEAGSGKSHLLTHLLTNALSNGKKCLVVANNLGALQQQQFRLSQLGFGHLSFLLRDTVTDKPLLLSLLRAEADSILPSVNYDEKDFRIALDKTVRAKRKLDEKYFALRQKVFGQCNWTETVGLFLKSNRLAGKELLNSQLNPQDFQFDDEEYPRLREAIEKTRPLYGQINTLKHPLTILNLAIFSDNSKEGGRSFTEKLLKLLLDKTAKLQLLYINKINRYSDKLKDHYERYYQNLVAQLNPMKDEIADFQNRFGTGSGQAGSGKLRFYGLFSGKYRDIVKKRDEIRDNYHQLIESYRQSDYFDYAFNRSISGKNIAGIKSDIEAFEMRLGQWHGSIPAIVQEEVQRLSLKTTRPGLDFETEISGLEDSLDRLIEELNRAGLYRLELENKMLTIPMRLKYLEEIIEKLENTQLHLRDFDPFYDWQRNWLQLPLTSHKLVRALVKVKPANWENAFQSWYLFNCLTKAFKPALPAENHAIRDFAADFDKLKPLLPPQIKDFWQKRSTEALKNLKRNKREEYNLMFGKKNNELSEEKTFIEVFSPAFETITDFLPVLQLTSHIAAEMALGGTARFDYIFLEEAHQMPLALGLKAISLGKKAIILGDPGLITDGENTSLLAYARRRIKPLSLNNIYRRNPGNILQLRNAGPVNEDAIEKPGVHFEQLDGRFDEKEGTNDEEAQHLIRLLNKVKKTPQRTYPNVGIVCFTVEQRNLVADYLLKIKQKNLPGAEVIQQLERNGLGVFHLEELHGLHFDVLVISGTYGSVDHKGTLTRNIYHLNRPEAVQRIILLMSRARKEVFIINSIPLSGWQLFQENPQQKGTFYLANYFFLARAVQEGSADAQRKVIQRIRESTPKEEHKPKPQTFLEEAALELDPYFADGRLQRNVKSGQLSFPLLIKAVQENELSIAIQADGFFSDSPATDYCWEYREIQRYKEQGYGIVPAWSVNWWKDPRLEAKKLVGAIMREGQADSG